jgi:hypothetical protein
VCYNPSPQLLITYPNRSLYIYKHRVSSSCPVPWHHSAAGSLRYDGRRLLSIRNPRLNIISPLGHAIQSSSGSSQSGQYGWSREFVSVYTCNLRRTSSYVRRVRRPGRGEGIGWTRLLLVKSRQPTARGGKTFRGPDSTSADGWWGIYLLHCVLPPHTRCRRRWRNRCHRHGRAHCVLRGRIGGRRRRWHHHYRAKMSMSNWRQRAHHGRRVLARLGVETPCKSPLH